MRTFTELEKITKSGTIWSDGHKKSFNQRINVSYHHKRNVFVFLTVGRTLEDVIFWLWSSDEHGSLVSDVSWSNLWKWLLAKTIMVAALPEIRDLVGYLIPAFSASQLMLGAVDTSAWYAALQVMSGHVKSSSSCSLVNGSTSIPVWTCMFFFFCYQLQLMKMGRSYLSREI